MEGLRFKHGRFAAPPRAQGLRDISEALSAFGHSLDCAVEVICLD